MNTKVTRILVTALAACSSAAALADSAAAPEIARGQAIYEEAQQAGGMAAAPVEMQSAQSNLGNARTAANKGDADRAARLAERAEADAQLAIAKAREQTAQNSARQIQDGLATLRQELNQNVNTAPPTPLTPVPGNNSEENNHDRS